MQPLRKINSAGVLQNAGNSYASNLPRKTCESRDWSLFLQSWYCCSMLFFWMNLWSVELSNSFHGNIRMRNIYIHITLIDEIRLCFWHDTKCLSVSYVHPSPIIASMVSLVSVYMFGWFCWMIFSDDLSYACGKTTWKRIHVSTDGRVVGNLETTSFSPKSPRSTEGTMHRFHRWDWCHWTSARRETGTIHLRIMSGAVVVTTGCLYINQKWSHLKANLNNWRICWSWFHLCYAFF